MRHYPSPKDARGCGNTRTRETQIPWHGPRRGADSGGAWADARRRPEQLPQEAGQDHRDGRRRRRRGHRGARHRALRAEAPRRQRADREPAGGRRQDRVREVPADRARRLHVDHLHVPQEHHHRVPGQGHALPHTRLHAGVRVEPLQPAPPRPRRCLEDVRRVSSSSSTPMPGRRSTSSSRRRGRRHSPAGFRAAAARRTWSGCWPSRSSGSRSTGSRTKARRAPSPRWPASISTSRSRSPTPACR